MLRSLLPSVILNPNDYNPNWSSHYVSLVGIGVPLVWGEGQDRYHNESDNLSILKVKILKGE